jgi:hypothetical protein
VSSGLVIEKVESIGVKCRICFPQLPKRMVRDGKLVHIDSDMTLKEFLVTLVEDGEILWSQYRRGNDRHAHSGVAIFASERAAEAACSNYEQE